MNILYGVQSTGNGHISRSKVMVRALKSAGHEVSVVLSGRPPEKLWGIEEFEPYTAYRGLTFITEKSRIKYLKTTGQLNFFRFFRDMHAYSQTRFDLAVIDFEPIAARIAARLKIPRIGLGHQYAFWYPIPLPRREWISLAVIRHFAPVDYPIGLHWHHFDQPILPPILPPIDQTAINTEPNKVLVYLPFENPDDILRLPTAFPEFQFFIYHDLPAAQDRDNVHLRPYSRRGFHADLLSCERIISNAGFALGSEALTLGKSLLVHAVRGQLEQEANAFALQQLGMADTISSLALEPIRGWLEKPARTEPFDFPNIAPMIVKWLEKGNWENIMELQQTTWKGFRPPAQAT